MAWIESHDTIWEHHKTVKLCEKLKIGRAQAVGHLHALWHFVLRNAWRKANLEAWGDAEIERAMFWEGEKNTLINALREVGFLDGFVVHGWLDRASRLVGDRIYNEKRRKTSVKRRKSPVNLRKTAATVPNPTVQKTPPLTPPCGDGRTTPLADKPPEATFPSGNGKNNSKPPGEKPPFPETSNGKFQKFPGSSWKPPDFIPKLKTDVSVQKPYRLPNDGIRTVVHLFKAVLQVDMDDRNWDAVYFRRYARPAKEMFTLFDGNLERIAKCMDSIVASLEAKNLSWTPETIVKHAGDWKNGRLFA